MVTGTSDEGDVLTAAGVRDVLTAAGVIEGFTAPDRLPWDAPEELAITAATIPKVPVIIAPIIAATI
jgi:hypothetical protein